MLQQFRDESGLPSSVTFPSDAQVYRWLTKAETIWKPKVAAVYPYHMFSAPTLMTTSDGGVTYTVSGETAPLAIEVYTSLTGDRLTVGQYNDQGADYTWEGSRIRMTNSTARTFATSTGAPYARYVASPSTVDGSTQSTINPSWARQLLVDRALILFARAKPGTDAAKFEKQETDNWTFIEESLKNSNIFYGDSANRGGRRVTGIGYLGLRYGG